MRKILYLCILTLLWAGVAGRVYAHCQVPCGIYDDHARVMMMLEDAATTEKALVEMEKLSGRKDLQSQNQMVRWVVNKEKHAENIIATISDYFLTQRVKESQKDYEERLVNHHRVITGAMKVKQSANMEDVKKLKKDIEALRVYYPEHKH